MTCKGVVKNNVVILEEGAYLPDGATVVVTVQQAIQEEVFPEEIAQRQALVVRMKEFSQRLAGRNLDLGDLILEGREELENRA